MNECSTSDHACYISAWPPFGLPVPHHRPLHLPPYPDFLLHMRYVYALFDISQCEPGGIFKLSQAQGEVPAGLETHVVVRFAPEQHGNFYRRLFCLIQDGPVLFIDMLGTAYDDQQRPAPLKQKHVDMFRLRPQKLKRMNPDHLLERIKASPDQQPPVGKQERLLEQEYKQQDPTRSGETVRSSIAAAKEHFKGFMQKSAEVTVSDETIDFGQASPYDLPPKKTVQITNRTSGRMTVVWQIPDSVDGDDELDWEVIPPAADVLPGQSTSFSVRLASITYYPYHRPTIH